MRMPALVQTAAVLAACLALSGCARKSDPRAGVRTLIDDVRAAAEDRDAPTVTLRLTEDFRGTDGIDRAGALASLRQYFAAYEKVRVGLDDVTITPRSTTEADVTCRVELTGAPRKIGALAALLPPSAVYRFELHVVRPSGPDWMVQSAQWQSLEARPSP